MEKSSKVCAIIQDNCVLLMPYHKANTIKKTYNIYIKKHNIATKNPQTFGITGSALASSQISTQDKEPLNPVS